MTNFEQAVKWMREGKKVKRKVWKEKLYFETNNKFKIDDDITKIIMDSYGEQVDYFTIAMFIAKDWEIYEETTLKEASTQ